MKRIVSFLNKHYKQIVCAAIAGTILAAGCATAAFSFAWFSNRNNISDDIKGQTAGAYFARGKGTKDDPYVINRPIHLYNLAWLQYVGYFENKEPYFIIESDLDMTNWVLPPIGTTKYPFTGHLDGYSNLNQTNQTHSAIISNLKVSNEFSEYPKHPSSVENVQDLNIMGVFGVIGEKNTTYSSEQAPSVKNLYIKNTTINDTESSTLAGIAAGYVNGVVSGIGIAGNSSIALPKNQALSSYGGYTTNISDYTSIGYCEDAYKSNIYNSNVSLNTADPEHTSGTEGEGGSEAGNGGSIDMNAMYTQLSGLRDSLTTGCAPLTRTIKLDPNGNVLSDECSDFQKDLRNYASNFDYYYSATEQKNNSNTVTSSYTFVNRIQRDTKNDFVYLYGENELTASNLQTTTTIYQDRYAQYISDSTGNYYLSVPSGTGGTGTGTGTGGSVIGSSTKDKAPQWFLDGEGYLYFYKNNDKTQPPSYLTYLNGALDRTYSKEEAVQWKKVESGEITYLEWDGNALQCDSKGKWSLLDTNSYSKIYRNYSNIDTYLSYDSSKKVVGTTNESQAKGWDFDNNGLFTKISQVKYYLTSEDGTNMSLSQSPKDNAFFTKKWGNEYISIRIGDSDYFLTLYEGNVQLSKDYQIVSYKAIQNNSPTTLKFENGDTSSSFTISQQTETTTYKTNPTYFPIANINGVPTDNNTGYVVSGSKFEEDLSKYQLGQLGDIRVSKYAKSETGDLLSNIYTVNNDKLLNARNGDFSIFDHYEETLEKYKEIYEKDQNNVYGLHFMDAQISEQSLVKVNYAKIRAKEYSQGFQLPMDSIDFNLTAKGYVNFFAGTYFPNNRSFFSLHEVERDESGANITHIREISEIYKNPTAKDAQSYVYKYTDGTYSVPFLHGADKDAKYNIDGSGSKLTVSELVPTASMPDGYTTKIFDTKWIKMNDITYDEKNYMKSNSTYYYEIPINAGEYALGSVSGSDGAYLCYLDIGANAQRTDVTSIAEIKTVSTYIYSYPKGVSFSFIGDNAQALPTIDEKDNASFSLSASFAGNIVVARTSATDISYTADVGDSVSTIYKGLTVNLTGNNKQITSIQGKLIKTVKEKTYTQVSYSLFNGTSSTTLYKEITTVDYSKLEQGEETTTREIYKNGIKDDTLEWLSGISFDKATNEVATLVYSYTDSLNVTISISSDLSDNYDETAGTHYYTISGYHIVITTDTEVEVVLTSLKDNTLTIKLKTGTGDSENDYTSLTVNISQVLKP